MSSWGPLPPRPLPVLKGADATTARPPPPSTESPSDCNPSFGQRRGTGGDPAGGVRGPHDLPWDP